MAEASAAHPEAAATDPTVANAGLTELDTTTEIPIHPAQSTNTIAPAVASIDANAGNAAADEHWDNKVAGSDDPLAESFEIVPRNPSETETPIVSAGVQSWADDAANAAAISEPTSATTPNTNGNDGFREVHHGRGGRGRPGDRGGYRGRGRGGGYRGDRGDGYRGRGRGGFRGRGRGESST